MEEPATQTLVLRSSSLPVASDDAAICRRWIAHHSKSFYLSSLLLPQRVRHGAWALYAFCRRADDAVDEISAGDGLARVEALRHRLDSAYSDRISDDPIDRAYRAVATQYRIPRALPEALLAGMEMDARGERYRTWEDLYRYCFRVASSVGLMMTRVMGWSREDAFLRAADLGVAMQLTNIARDVGDDAARGRVYLPDELLESCGTQASHVLRTRIPSPALRQAVAHVLRRATEHYAAADRGIPLLPQDCRLAIAASRRIYSAIGNDIMRHHFDSVTRRAHTSLPRKLWLVLRSLRARKTPVLPPTAGPADAILDRLLNDVGLGAIERKPTPHPAA